MKINVKGIFNKINIFKKLFKRKKTEEVNQMEVLLNHSIENKILILLYNNTHRGLGKTHALIKKANETGATIVVKNYPSRVYVKEQAEKLGFKNVSVVFFGVESSVKGTNFKKGILVDEGVNPGVLKELSVRNQVLGGFVNIYN